MESPRGPHAARGPRVGQHCYTGWLKNTTADNMQFLRNQLNNFKKL